MIIYHNTKLGFLNDVSNNYLQTREDIVSRKAKNDAFFLLENRNPRTSSSMIHLALIPPIVRRRPQHSQT